MNPKNRILSPKLLIALTGLGMISGSAQAELIAYDQFSGYADGSLVGQGQGFGWGSNTWVGAASTAGGAVASTTGNLTYAGVTSAGGGAISGTNSSSDNGWLLRNLENPITTTGTYYFGFLMDETGNPSKAAFRIQDSAGQRNAGAGAWDGQANWQLYYTQNGSAYNKIDSGIARADTTGTNFFVIKVNFSTTAAETASIYINPTSALDLAGGGAANFTYTSEWSDINRVQASLNGVSGKTGTMAFDEIRIGTEAADMFGAISGSSTFSSWIGGFDVGGETAFTDDPDDDGNENGIENYFGTDPSEFSQGVVSGTLTGNTFTFTHPLNATPASDISASYRWSKDLASFHGDGVEFETTTVTFSQGAPSGGIVEVTATITGTAIDKLFVDIEVTQP